ncbi:MAG: sulfite exporter TauE/SafE family protein [Desulfosporosinus sp.]|nr:sulfite exporter TauE/SafE family protein [Desulfosporosinus sp.]
MIDLAKEHSGDCKKLHKKERLISLTMYAALLIVWSYVFFSKFDITLYRQYFQIPLTMVFGSFLGGFTCEGGGAVAFPIFTKLLHISPAVTRDFSFAIQSIGMSFASITILLRKIRIEMNVILYAVMGGIAGIIIGTYTVSPYLSSPQVKLIFTMVITSFGVALFLKNYIFRGKECDQICNFTVRDSVIISCVGVIGGVFSSIIGTGIHFITFSFVTLFYRLNEKVATPTSILIMAADSIFGFIFRKFIYNEFSDQAIVFWVLCIPVVALFAPLGAIACSKVSRSFIVKVLLFLISIEFISTLYIFKFNLNTICLSLLVIFVSMVIYLILIRISGIYALEMERLKC